MINVLKSTMNSALRPGKRSRAKPNAARLPETRWPVMVNAQMMKLFRKNRGNWTFVRTMPKLSNVATLGKSVGGYVVTSSDTLNADESIQTNGSRVKSKPKISTA